MTRGGGVPVSGFAVWAVKRGTWVHGYRRLGSLGFAIERGCRVPLQETRGVSGLASGKRKVAHLAGPGLVVMAGNMGAVPFGSEAAPF
jgi:hypothetical protein